MILSDTSRLPVGTVDVLAEIRSLLADEAKAQRRPGAEVRPLLLGAEVRADQDDGGTRTDGAVPMLSFRRGGREAIAPGGANAETSERRVHDHHDEIAQLVRSLVRDEVARLFAPILADSPLADSTARGNGQPALDLVADRCLGRGAISPLPKRLSRPGVA